MGFLSKIGGAIHSSSSGMFGNISNSTSDVVQGLTNQIKDTFNKDNLENVAVNVAGGIFNKTLSSLKDGVLQGIMNSVNGRIGINGLQPGNSGYFYGEDYATSLGMQGYCTFTDFYTNNEKIIQERNSLAIDKNRLHGLNIRYINDNDAEQIADPALTQSINWHQTLHTPDWGYDTFINERSIFQKGLTTPFGDPGYFYFKIFFKFDTQFGLLGGILNDVDDINGGHNTAMKYLSYLDGGNSGYYQSLLPAERMSALRKFAKSLSYINCNAPWFFRSIKGLDKAGNPITNEFSKERSIEIECNVDAIDMRLSTLLDLYHFVAYDDFSNKEVLPENLRKFDITVLIFNTPIKTLHTAINGKQNLPFKQASPHNTQYTNLMSYKLFEFNGCEIAPDSIGSMIPGDVNNETPFNIGKGIIKITYDRCNVYTSNETNGILFGSTGFFYDYDKMVIGNDYKQTRVDAYNNKYTFHDAFTDVSEEYTKNNLIKLSGYSLGNLYGEDNIHTYPPDGTKIGGKPTEYFKSKIRHLHDRKNPILQLGGSLLARMLSSSMNSYASLGYLEGYKERGPNSEWWKYKISKLTSDYPHLWTTAPHDHKLIAGHDIGERNYNKSAYVQNQELEDSLASVDKANNIGSYALRDTMKRSMQDLKKRAERGEFVGPGSKAFNNKIAALKSGSHESTDAPHMHKAQSSDKYIQQLKENTLYGETNLLNKPKHEFTTPPYNLSRLKMNVEK